MAYPRRALAFFAFGSLLAWSSCSVDEHDHRKYGATCAQGEQSYRGYCLAAGDAGTKPQAGTTAQLPMDRPMTAPMNPPAVPDASMTPGMTPEAEPPTDSGTPPMQEAGAAGTTGTAGTDERDAMMPDCIEATTRACYSGAPATREHSPCRAGMQRCSAGSFGPCEGEVLPQVETCTNSGVDEDCDGHTDEGFDLENDPRNCGACGRSCGADESCCDGDCVDTRGSSSHCGACGNRCGSGLHCCDGSCYNLGSDQNNCGSCGNACGLLEGCCRTACRLLSLGC